MTVPKTTVDKYHGSIARKHEIRLPRKVANVEAKPKSETVKPATDN